MSSTTLPALLDLDQELARIAILAGAGVLDQDLHVWVRATAGVDAVVHFTPECLVLDRADARCVPVAEWGAGRLTLGPRLIGTCAACREQGEEFARKLLPPDSKALRALRTASDLLGLLGAPLGSEKGPGTERSYAWDDHLGQRIAQFSGLFQARHQVARTLSTFVPVVPADLALEQALRIAVDSLDAALRSAHETGLERKHRWAAYAEAVNIRSGELSDRRTGVGSEDFDLSPAIVELADAFLDSLWGVKPGPEDGWTDDGMDDLVARVSAGPTVWVLHRPAQMWTTSFTYLMASAAEFGYLDDIRVLARIPAIAFAESRGGARVVEDDGYEFCEVRQAIDVGGTDVAATIAALRATDVA